MKKILFILAVIYCCVMAQAQEPPVLPTPANNQIMYRSSDHQKITPNATDAFGAIYDDANSMYDT